MTTQLDGKLVPATTDHPQAFKAFMREGWKRRTATVKPLPTAKAHATRRAALARLFPGEALVVPTGHEQTRSNDTHHRFRPGSDFVYLTGCHEPDCVLVLVPGASGHTAHLFVEPNPGRADDTFFTDRKKGELWVGPRLGVPESRVRYGVDHAHPLETLGPFLQGLGGVRVVRGLSEPLDVLRPKEGDGSRDLALSQAIAELRLHKDALEIKELGKAIASTQRGFEDVLRALPRTTSEREVEGRFALRARVEGNDVGYGTIAAAGAHACILHWNHNDGAVKKGQLVLLDAGVEARSLYTADITRTVPVSGRYSKAQREVALIVWEAHQAAMAAVKPGAHFMEPNRRAQRVLAEGLVKLGVLKVSADEAVREDQQLQKRWSLHNVSHMLGLDVHDCAKARNEVYKGGPLAPGMVLTIEPGLYFQPDDLTVPARLRGIGVRLENDVLVTKTGHRNLSQRIPSHPDEIEAWMRRLTRRA